MSRFTDVSNPKARFVPRSHKSSLSPEHRPQLLPFVPRDLLVSVAQVYRFIRFPIRLQTHSYTSNSITKETPETQIPSIKQRSFKLTLKTLIPATLTGVIVNSQNVKGIPISLGTKSPFQSTLFPIWDCCRPPYMEGTGSATIFPRYYLSFFVMITTSHLYRLNHLVTLSFCRRG